MQPNLHAHRKDQWNRLHVDEDLDRFIGRLADAPPMEPEPAPYVSDI